LNDPAWLAVRFKMVRTMPDKLDELWLGKYRELRHGFEKSNPQSRQRALEASLQFYKDNRAAMDAGAKASWEWCYTWDDKAACEISALQHAMNILIDDGPEVFYRECQNDTRDVDADKGERIGWRDVAQRTIGIPRGQFPNATTHLTAQIDVHDKVLSWGVIGWTQNFGGHIGAYGTLPEQGKKHFIFRKVTRTLADIAVSGSDLDGQIYQGLETLITQIVEYPWQLVSAGPLSISRILIDAGYKARPVNLICHNSQYSALLTPAKGRGVKASERPISEWRLVEGARRGEEWILQRPAKRSIPMITFDANYWKRKAYEQIAMPVGNTHAITLFDGSEREHQMFGEHVTCERWREVTYSGRKVHEWYELPNRPDNHYWDFVVGATVAASASGITRTAAERVVPKRGKRKVKYY
jgi:hypothetical protein